MTRRNEPAAALFNQPSRTLLALLQAASNERAVFAALRWGWGELDRTFAATPAPLKAAVACRAGCDFCCRVPLGVQAHEVLLAADHIQSHFTPEELAETIARAAAHRARVAAPGATLRGGVGYACAALRNRRCSIYEARPEICRAHHTSDAQVCAAFLADPAVDLERVYLPPLRARLFAVMLGIDQAVAAAGFDERAYDFGAALHVALTDSLCAFLWARKKPAFPDSCLEPQEEDSRRTGPEG
jgi:Fe-S-cluster containining protein